jgi:hypothetical protein
MCWGRAEASRKGAATVVPTSWAPFEEGCLQDLRSWVGTLYYFCRGTVFFRGCGTEA